MNERIEELAGQAFQYAADNADATGKGQLGVFADKFAELIVRECIGCCEQTISDPVPKSVDTFEQGGVHCIDEIKQHFGVEE